jgi:hypothetical protein
MTRNTISGKRVTIGDLEGMEVELDQLLGEKGNSDSGYDAGIFDIPDFLR